jgi:hypothetical protein
MRLSLGQTEMPVKHRATVTASSNRDSVIWPRDAGANVCGSHKPLPISRGILQHLVHARFRQLGLKAKNSAIFVAVRCVFGLSEGKR